MKQILRKILLGVNILVKTGGVETIVDIDNYTSRLKIEIKDKNKINQRV